MKTTSFKTEKSNRTGFLPRWLSRGRTPAPSAPATPPPIPREKKILVVDDDAVILKTTALKLQAQGFTVAQASDASSAIGATRTEKPDLILLDITFPPDIGAVAWDGFLIMSWLRRSETAKHIPIVVMTGGERTKYEARAMAGGAAAFFHKPLDHDKLLEVIEKALDTRPAPRPADAVFEI